MKAVGLKTLKNNLSRFIKDVANGETITIGSRGRRPIARLVPVDVDPELEKVSQLAASGVIQFGVGKPGAHRPVKPRPTRHTVADIVSEDRR